MPQGIRSSEKPLLELSLKNQKPLMKAALFYLIFLKIKYSEINKNNAPLVILTS